MQPEKEPSSKGSTIALALLFGLLGAGMRSGFDGFVVGALLGALLAQVWYLRGRTQSLDQQLRALQASLKTRAPVTPQQAPAAESVAPAPASPAAAVPTAATAPVAPAATWTPAPGSTAASTPAAATEDSARFPGASPRTGTPRPRTPSKPIEPTAIDRAIAEFVVWIKRGNPLARIGIVILFFGAAFLAKYAADNSLFPIELRFIGLALGALALLAVGWRLRTKRAVYAQLLQGGGIAGLYLTIFAATKLYDLLPIGLAFGLMVLVALAAAVIAVGQNALSLAVIGTAGGFLAPVLVSTGSGNHIALFSYYTVLNLGVFAVAWFRTWRVLNVLGFVFTFTITGLWRASGYDDADLLSGDSFLVLFFLMYVAVSILNCVRQPPDLKGYVSGSLVFGLPVVAFGLHASMVAHIEYALAWSAFTLGAFYLLLGWTLYRTGRASFRLLVEAFAALGVIFASLAIPLAFDTHTTAAMWAVEGAGLLWLGVRQERKLARAFGGLLQAAAGCGYLLGLYSMQAEQPLLNSVYLGALMLGVSGVFSGYWLFLNREQQASYEAGAQVVFTLWGVAWWLFGGLNEIDRFLDPAALGAALAYVALTTALLAWLGIQRQWRLPLLTAAYLPAATAVFALAHAASLHHPFVQWGAAGWVLLLAAHYFMLRLGDARTSADGNWPGSDWLHAGATWVIVLLISWEASWQLREQTTGVWARLPWGWISALALAWLGRVELRPRWPVAVHAKAYRIYAAVPLAIAVGIWIVQINLSSTGDATWLPYVPLFNPLDISVALCLAALAMWWSALGESERATLWQQDLRVLLAIAAAIVFLWLNAALIRALHHNFGAPITPYGMVHSTLVQASLSIFWGVLGFIAMTLAARQRWRVVWLAGAALMIVVVAKLFVFDLSNVGTVARITSFLTVGLLLLVTGYLAPLPPRREGDRLAA